MKTKLLLLMPLLLLTSCSKSPEKLYYIDYYGINISGRYLIINSDSVLTNDATHSVVNCGNILIASSVKYYVSVDGDYAIQEYSSGIKNYYCSISYAKNHDIKVVSK